MPEFTDLVLCGYQGWFAAGEDNTLERWSHWSKRGAPSPGNTAFELYPDVREYPAEALKASGYGDLGDGSDSRLFGTERNGVVNLHFRWMKDYGIDGVALQRFLQPTRKPKNRAWRNKVAGKVRHRSEAHGRHFYVMWDLSGAEWPSDEHATLEAEIRDDYEDHIQPLTASPQYARQGGKPVVAIWGFGFTNRHASIDDALATVAALRNDFGCYVVLGVPYRWRDELGDSLPGWLPAYESADMLIPWAVGRYKTFAELDGHINNIWGPDKAFCDARGIDMQRVIFPGFAWSNLKGQQVAGNAHALSRHAESQDQGAPINAIPRRQGDFLWGQAFRVAQHGTGAFVAMFDEYDEATAIAKAAESAAMTPADEYFLTLDADGFSVPADRYLWLTGKLTEMIKDPALADEQRPQQPAAAPPPPDPGAPAPPPDPVAPDPVAPAPPPDPVAPDPVAPAPPPDPVAPDPVAPAPPPDPVAPPPDPVAPAPPPPRWTDAEAPVVVEHAYRGLLDRDADGPGRDHFAGRLISGDTTEHVCQVLAASDEFRDTNDGATAAELAEQLYQGILSRQADPRGLAITVQRINEDKIGGRAAAMLESDEFRDNVLS